MTGESSPVGVDVVSAALAADLQRAASGQHPDPHQVFGPHEQAGLWRVRAWLPTAASCRVVTEDGSFVAVATGVPGAWIADIGPARAAGASSAAPTSASPVPAPAPAYQLVVRWAGGGAQDDDAEEQVEDPYRFSPTLGEVDLHLIGEGRHQQLWHRLGARVVTHQGVTGTAFAVWAPNARAVRLVGEWNFWEPRAYPMRSLGSSGVWELFVPAAEHGRLYKYEVLGADGVTRAKADPLAAAAEGSPGTASRIFRSSYQWGDASWMTKRQSGDPLRERMATYECHLGSWRQGRSFRDLAVELVEYVTALGFTHVEFLPVSEHPFGGSWGYQVSSYYAPTSRYGDPDDLRALIDACHQAELGVILDWVPAHFPADDWALSRFDGTALYEHADPRQGEHPDWGTLVFNFGRKEVRNFLVANAVYWLEEFHVDALRVDAVASMLYLDYSRQPGEWVPNVRGGRENLEAIDLLHEVNILCHRQGAFTVAEESTAWPGVTRPVHAGGLGFTLKWNLGWMHDTLDYFHHQCVHRRYHHGELTFGLLYAFTENFVLPLSHDEVVHGKESLLAKMPGDRWQQLANLRALYGWMWAHPGRPLLFMGGELAQEREWSHDRSLDWELLGRPAHAGVQTLVGTLNVLSDTYPAVWERDFDSSGFTWIEAGDADRNVLAFLRRGEAGLAAAAAAAAGSRGSGGRGPVLACIANLSPVVHHDYQLGLPLAGPWVEILNTDAPVFGGSGVVNGFVDASGGPWQGQQHSATMTLPPLAVVWLVPADAVVPVTAARPPSAGR